MATAITSELHNDDMMIVTATLTSNGSGLASVTTSHTYKGFLVQVETDPGSAAPTANWDLTIADSYLEDLTAGAAQNRHTSETEVLYQDDLHNGVACYGPLTFSASGMGDTNDAAVTLYLIRVM
tara:strand:+ start:816 stop:1187 length:372 start_codon:yes stop_codon:yes gene_type:complete